MYSLSLSLSLSLSDLRTKQHNDRFGKKPFGDGMSQDKLRRENIILNARTVKFPSNKKGGLNVSDEAKSFISECLEYDVHRRPDVVKLARHTYLRSRRKGNKK